MGQVTFRPELKNAGGETSDILYNQKTVGSMTLLYREGDRLMGSVQIDRAALPTSAYQNTIDHVHQYVESLIDALAVPFCQVTVTYGRYDHVIATEQHVGRVDRIYTDDPRIAAKPEKAQAVQGVKQRKRPAADDLVLEEDVTELNRPLELVIVGEGRHRVEYHVYDADQHLVAEALMRIKQGDVIGEVDWYLAPTNEEIDEITELIVTDFDPEAVDTFNISMTYEEEEVARIELTHEDFFDKEEDAVDVIVDDEHYDIRLLRDDRDSLTFEIFTDDRNHEKLGVATIDISGRQVSGYIDFDQPGSKEERETIATTLMREIDKEREYDTFNLSMLYKDELIDEIAFDQREGVH